MSDGDASYRVVTDPSEGPKQFTIQTRVTSRGETAVILMGVDCAERVMCHESAPFDLEEGHFVFKLGPGTAGILDQLLAQGALRVERVVDLGGRPGPVCVLTPGGAPQPAFEGAGAAAANRAHHAAASDAADASGNAFFDRLRAEDAQAASPGADIQRRGQQQTTRGGGRREPRDAADAGADILAMLQGGPAALRRRR